MSYAPQRDRFSLAAITTTLTEYWRWWRTTCDQAIDHYYSQRIEMNPEGEAQEYWNRLKHPRSGVDIYNVTDAMLSRLMQQLINQGISKFAVDRFILELRRHTRNAHNPVN